MRLTYQVMPDLDWSLLGEDAVATIEEYKKELAAEAGKQPGS